MSSPLDWATVVREEERRASASLDRQPEVCKEEHSEDQLPRQACDERRIRADS